MACPTVSGTAALLWAAKPDASWSEIRCAAPARRAPGRPHAATLPRCPLCPPACALALTVVPPYRDAILSSVDKVPALADKTITGGRLNVARAMTTLLGLPNPGPPPPPEPSECCTSHARCCSCCSLPQACSARPASLPAPRQPR